MSHVSAWLAQRNESRYIPSMHFSRHLSQLHSTSSLLAALKLRPQHGGAEPSGAGAGASQFPQAADFVGNASELRAH
ncbi:MAG: hypothetical protein EPO42_13790 [Gallionellaceae bacterium]|nr:MAG: hypothetical protein EPO42_13790 [Gallionellaceae bacterium]